MDMYDFAEAVDSVFVAKLLINNQNRYYQEHYHSIHSGWIQKHHSIHEPRQKRKR